MAIDPFGSYEDEAQTEPVFEDTPQPEVSTSPSGKLVLTFKLPGYNAPWAVAHMDSLDDATRLLDGDDGKAFAALLARMARVNKYAAKLDTGAASSAPASGGNSGGGSAAAAPGHQQPPADFPPMPEGWKYVTKMGANGVWHAYRNPETGKNHFINKNKATGKYFIADPK